MDFFIVVLVVDYHPDHLGFLFGLVRRVKPSSALFVRATDEADFTPLDGCFLLFCSSRHDNTKNMRLPEYTKKYELTRSSIQSFVAEFNM